MPGDDRSATGPLLDARTLTAVGRAARLRSEARRGVAIDPAWAAPVPREVGLQLTYRCNLRCAHCYQWGEQGFFRAYSSHRAHEELAVPIVEKVLAATAAEHSRIYLWGGEPLLHTRFADIARLLAEHGREVTLCTNGLLLEHRLDDLLRLGENLVVLVSVDGLEAAHDALRGPGTFSRTRAQIEALIRQQRAGRFAGAVSLSCVVSDDNAGSLFELAGFAEAMGVHSLHLQLPWFIGPAAARAMDAFCEEHLPWLGARGAARGSWHAYAHRVSPATVPILRAELARIAGHRLALPINHIPRLRDVELDAFLEGEDAPVQGRTSCLAVANRLDVHADGRAGSCKFFPELAVGDLRHEEVAALWHGSTFTRLRTAVREAGRMPVCSRCSLLYRNGDS